MGQGVCELVKDVFVDDEDEQELEDEDVCLLQLTVEV